MTRLAGDAIASADLDGETMQSLAGQLTDMVMCWRCDIPHQQHCGNVQAVQTEHVPVIEVSALKIRGIFSEGIDMAAPITNANDTYSIKLTEKLTELESSGTYAPNKTALAASLRAFIADSLPGSRARRSSLRTATCLRATCSSRASCRASPTSSTWSLPSSRRPMSPSTTTSGTTATGRERSTAHTWSALS